MSGGPAWQHPGIEPRVSRRELLGRAAGAGAALSLAPLLAACGGGREAEDGAGEGPSATVRWISPSGTLDVMNDYPLWVAVERLYFADLGIEARLSADPAGAGPAVTFVAERRADVGYPSPGQLAKAVDGGIAIRSIWAQFPGQLFDFALPADSTIVAVDELEGKRIAVGAASWAEIVDPLLVEAGVDPDSVTLVEAGADWNRTVAEGGADAGLSWEGLRAQLAGLGLELRFLLGADFSKGPSNVYAVRSADLDDRSGRDVYTRFLQGVVMAEEFARANPRAAAQLTYRRFPALASTITPQVALEWMVQLAAGYGATERAGRGWGYHEPEVWAAYLRTIAELGHTSRRLAPEDVLTNELVVPVNEDADVGFARADGEGFELDDDFAATTVPGDLDL